MKKTKSEYRRIGEVAKRLFSKSWVTRYGGGDEAEAAKRLAKKYGFSGMEPYMHTLCKLFVDCPERAHFESAVASLVEGTARQIIPSARELVRENRRNSQDRVDAFPVDGALGWRLRLPD